MLNLAQLRHGAMLKNCAMICGAVMLAAAPSAAMAQAAPKKPVAAAAAAEELSGTARLNAEQAAKAQAEAAAYQARVGSAVATETRNETAFEEATYHYEYDKTVAAQQAADERLKWEADVAACKAGDQTRCAAAPTAPATPADPK